MSATVYYVGAEGCVALSSVVASKGYRDYEYKMGVGYKASIPVVIKFSDIIGFETGVSVYGKYYRYSQEVVGFYNKKQTNFDLDFKNGFVTFPVALRLSYPISPFDIYTSLGGYLGVWAYGNMSGKVINGNDKSENVNEETDLSFYNRFDSGVRVSVGTGVNFGSFYGYLQWEYDFFLTDMNKRQKHGAYRMHNSTFLVTLGLLWGIDK